jgi:hypothetical protein
VMQIVDKPQLGPVGIHQGLDDADDGGTRMANDVADVAVSMSHM